jgi:hypothetical protein
VTFVLFSTIIVCWWAFVAKLIAQTAPLCEHVASPNAAVGADVATAPLPAGGSSVNVFGMVVVGFAIV